MTSSVGFYGRSNPVADLRRINGCSATVTSWSFHCYRCNRTVTVLIWDDVDAACPLCYKAFLEKMGRTNFSPSPPLATAVGSVTLPDDLSSISDSDSDSDIEFSFPLPPQPPPPPPPFPRFTTAAVFNSDNEISESSDHLPPPPLFPPLPAGNLTHNCADFRRTLRLPTLPSPTSASGAVRPLPLPLPPPPPPTAATGTRVASSSSRQLIQPSYPLPPPPPFSPPRTSSFRGYLFPYPDPIPIMELWKEKILVESSDRKMSQELMRSESEEEGPQCAVCLENLEVDETVKRMPCDHVFHSDCILRWLDSQRHRTCPVCRYELPWNCVTDLLKCS